MKVLMKFILLIATLFLVYSTISLADCDYDYNGLYIETTKVPPVLKTFEYMTENVAKPKKVTRFYQFDIKKWKLGKELTKKEYENLPALKNKTKKMHYNKQNEKEYFISSRGTRFEYKPKKCKNGEEGGPFCSEIEIYFNKKKLIVDCEKLSSGDCGYLKEIDEWGEQIWLGLSSVGECSEYGEGLYVFDVKTLKLLFSAAKPTDHSFLNVKSITPNVEENSIWIDTDDGVFVYNKKFELLKTCKFDPYSHSSVCEHVK